LLDDLKVLAAEMLDKVQYFMRVINVAEDFKNQEWFFVKDPRHLIWARFLANTNYGIFNLIWSFF
jgi:hypothetical protein